MRLIAHISDLHFGYEDMRVADGLAADLHAVHPHVVVVSGDLTQRARRRQFRRAAAYLQRLPEPQIVIPGNHDIPLFDVIRRFFFPLDRYRDLLSAEMRPFYRDDEIAILGINTARSWTWRWKGFWKDGRISPEQLEDIRHRLGEARPEFRVVVTHHPFIPAPGERAHGIVGQAAQALAMMEQCGVDMVLAGHLHIGYSGDVRTHHEAVRRSILSIQAGTAISTRRRHEPNAYNLIEIDGGTVIVHVRTWDGCRFAQAEDVRYMCTDGMWQRQA